MEGVLDWRAKRDASLRTKDGWLTLVGLDWLKIGRDLVNQLRLLKVITPLETALPAVVLCFQPVTRHSLVQPP